MARHLRLDEPGGKDSRFPAVAAGAGGVVVAWTALEGAGERLLFARRLDPSGTPTGEVSALSHGGNLEARAALAMNGEGELGIAWVASSGHSGGQVFARLLAAGGSPLTGEIPLGAASRGHPPAIASDPTSGFLVVWEQGSAIEGAVLPRQPGHQRTFAVVASEPGAVRWDPAIAASAASGHGEMLVTWQERMGRSSGIRCRFLHTSDLAPLSPPSWLAPPSEGFALSASVQADAAGTYLALWERTPSVVARHLSRPATTSRPMTAADVECWRSHLGQALARLGPLGPSAKIGAGGASAGSGGSGEGRGVGGRGGSGGPESRQEGQAGDASAANAVASRAELALVPAVNSTVLGMLRATMLQGTPAVAPGASGSPPASSPADSSPQWFYLDLARGKLHKIAGASDVEPQPG